MFLDSIGDAISGAVDAVGGALGDVFGGAVDTLGGIAGGLGGILGGVMNPMSMVPNLLDTAGGLVDSLLPNLGLPNLLGPLSDIVGGVFGGLTQAPNISQFQPMPLIDLSGMFSAQGAGGEGGGSIESILLALAGKMDAKMGELKNLAGGIDPNNQKSMADFQLAMQSYNQFSQLLSTAMKDFSDMNMAIVRNVKL